MDPVSPDPTPVEGPSGPSTDSVSTLHARDPERLSGAEAGFVARMREHVAQNRILRRPHTLAELRADSAFEMKYREKPAHLSRVDEAGWERFALALADAEAAKKLAHLLPAAAEAARIAGDPALAAFVLDQLGELATWAPLQRAGWSGGSATPGAWLGTGWAVRAIVRSIAQLPEDALSPELRAALLARLEAEIAGIREDWRTQRTWFARIEAVSSNQWVLPLEALALASLHGGLDRHREDYEFAIAGLLRSLNAQGTRGECVEGMLYGAITYESLLAVALAARSVGDDRLIKHPWLHAFPTWYLHHRQPGGFVINAFDSQATDLNWPLVGMMAADLGHAGSRWLFAHRPHSSAASPLTDLAALRLANETAAGSGRAPVPFAAYQVAARINWVQSASAFTSGPENRVSGFWMRGGDTSDAHDHQDRGHVNFIVAGRPVLIEAGLASYGIPEHPTHYKSVAGHNVLQVGGHPPEALNAAVLAAGAGQILDPSHRAAPMTVHRLDTAGGSVSVDASGCYATVRRWVRTVTWDAEAVCVHDSVELVRPDIVLFRWHLGAPDPAGLERRRDREIRVDDIVLAWETSGEAPMTATIESMPDNTLHRNTPGRHATVVLQTVQPVESLTLTTRVFLEEPGAR